MARLPRSISLRRRRRPGPAGQLGRRHRHEHPLEGRHSRPRALEPDRLGRPAVRHFRGQQPRRRDVQARALWRGHRVGGPHAAAMGRDCDRSPDGQDDLAADRLRRRAERKAPHQSHLRQRHARHRRPLRRRVLRLAGALRLRHRRPARLAEGPRRARTSAPTICPNTSGARPVRRSSTRTSSSCSATRRRGRS